jgi:hypothetical protein
VKASASSTSCTSPPATLKFTINSCACHWHAEQQSGSGSGPERGPISEAEDLTTVAPAGALRLCMCVLHTSSLKSTFGPTAKPGVLRERRAAVLEECFASWQTGSRQELQRGCLFVQVRSVSVAVLCFSILRLTGRFKAGALRLLHASSLKYTFGPTERSVRYESGRVRCSPAGGMLARAPAGLCIFLFLASVLCT